jgi:basic amino acid/polyamine antiporter, APA family
MTNTKKKMGLVMATALVVGNMVGSGIFMLPASLASQASISATLMAWVITGLGSILLALSFGKLSSRFPKTGGPYEYTKLAFGEFTGFLNAWLYYNGSWIGNAAIILTLTSYASLVFPILSDNPLVSFIFGSAVLWLLTFLNILGSREAGKWQTASTVFKVVLFAGFIIVALFNFDASNLYTSNASASTGFGGLPLAIATTLWAFVGLESSTVSAGEIENPQRNVKLSTIYGIIITIAIYLLVSIAAMGAMPQDKLASSSAPISDILGLILGSKAGIIVSISIVVATLGSIIGWILTTANIAYAAAIDGVFPKIFAKTHPKYNTPYMALIISSILTNLLLLMNFQGGLVAAFNFAMLLATLSYLPIYAMTAVADIMLTGKNFKNVTAFIITSIVPLLGFVYACYTIYGTGAETVLWGFMLMLIGMPFYVYNKLKNQNLKTNIDNKEAA